MASAPARPDYSRVAPPLATERIERQQDTLVKKRRTVDNLPNLLVSVSATIQTLDYYTQIILFFDRQTANCY
jgi:hypothetical protein